MTDPAVEAAERACATEAMRYVAGEVAIEAAREMARPIRDLIECCEEFGDELDIDDLKKLVYPKGEP